MKTHLQYIDNETKVLHYFSKQTYMPGNKFDIAKFDHLARFDLALFMDLYHKPKLNTSHLIVSKQMK